MTPVGSKSPLFKLLIFSLAIFVTVGASQAFAKKYRPKAEEDWVTYKNERFGFRLFYPSAIYSAQPDKKTEKTDNDAPADTPDNEELEAKNVETRNLNIGNIAVGPAKKAPARDATALKPDADPEVVGSIPKQTDTGSYKPETSEDDAEAEAAEAAAEDDDADGSSLTLLSEDEKSKIVVFGALNKDGVSPRKYRKILLDEFGGYDKLDYQPIGKTWFVLSGYRGDTIYYQKVMFSCRNRVVNVFSINFPIVKKTYYERLVEIMEDNFRTGHGTDTPSGCR